MGLKESGLRGSLRNVSVGIDAIPDSEADQKLVHRWLLSEDSDPFEDSESDADATNNGTTQVTGDYAGGAAREGDGTDDHTNAGELSNFFTSGVVDEDHAVAFTLETTDTGRPAGARESGTNIHWEIRVGETSSGSVSLRLIDDNINTNEVESTANVTDGEKYRVVLNVIGNNVSDWEVYVNQTEGSNVASDDGADLSDVASITEDFIKFATNNRGSASDHINIVIDDFCLFDDSLTSSEAQSYDNPWT